MLRREEGAGLKRAVDRLASLGQVPAVVEHPKEPGAGPTQQRVGGAEVTHAHVVVEQPASHLRPAADRLVVMLPFSSPLRCRAGAARFR
jgi:hypothetical protein